MEKDQPAFTPPDGNRNAGRIPAIVDRPLVQTREAPRATQMTLMPIFRGIGVRTLGLVNHHAPGTPDHRDISKANGTADFPTIRSQMGLGAEI